MDQDMKNKCHEGHRERMRKRFMQTENFAGFSEHEVLECILFYCYPRQDTNYLAHFLLNKFGSINNLLLTPADKIAESGLISYEVALTLKTISAASDYLVRHSFGESLAFNSKEEIRAYLRLKFFDVSDKLAIILAVDSSRRLRKCFTVAQGNLKNTNLNYSKISKAILNNGCTEVFFAHNYESNFEIPFTAEKLAKSLKNVDITLLEYYTINDNKIYPSNRFQHLW